MCDLVPEGLVWWHEWGMQPARDRGFLCEACNTTFEVLDADGQVPEEDPEVGYTLCRNCAADRRNWSNPLALDELCGCGDCWPEVERLWEDCEIRSARAMSQPDAGGN